MLKLKISQEDTEELFSNISIEEEIYVHSARRQGLPTLCETRWSSRVDSTSILLIK